MARSIKLSSDQKADWTEIARIPLADFQSISDVVLGLDIPIMTASDLKSLFNEHLSEDASIALARQLMAFCNFARALRIGSTEILDLLYQGFKRAFSEDVELISSLEDRKRLFERLATSASVQITEKTHYLGRDHASALISSALITDVRPIFENNRESILGGIVINYLKLEVFRDGNQESLSFVMDEADIDALVEQLQDAKKKTKASVSLFAEQLGLRSFVVGDDSIGSG